MSEFNSTDIDLVGKSLSNVSALKKFDRGKCKTLNLHNNMLNDISDLPRFLFLTELNISSNRFKFVPDLSFLPALTSLDVSGNMIESLITLPFLSTLKTLKMAYNCIKSLHGLTNANVPNLEHLDIRENPIVATEYEIQPIGTLYFLKDIAIQTNKIQIIALLFTSCPSLQFVDKKSQATWKEIAAKQLKEEARVEVNTPHFDKVAAKYKSTASSGQPSDLSVSRHSLEDKTPIHSPYRGVSAQQPRSKPLSPSLIPKYCPPPRPETLDGKKATTSYTFIVLN
jgi:Leucine-rich repeat (LRR) protein